MTIPFRHDRETVLVVDDDPQVCEAVRTMLERDGIRGLVAHSGAEGLRILEREHVCLALVDIEMPEMNGLDFCWQVRNGPLRSQLPIALVTGLTDAADVQAGIAVGATDYIKKPFDPDELRLRLRMQLRLHAVEMDERRTQGHLAVISDAAKDGIVIVDDRGRVVHWNRAAAQMFGLTEAEAMGRNLYEMIVAEAGEAERQGSLTSMHAMGATRGAGTTIEFVAKGPRGEALPVELSVSATRLDDGWYSVAIIRDVTERKRFENDLREREARYRGLFEGSYLPIMVLSPPDWRCSAANAAAAKVFGVEDPVELVGRQLWQEAPPTQDNGTASDQVGDEQLRQCLEVGRSEFDWLALRDDGSVFPTSVRLTRIDEGRANIVVVVIHDLSVRRSLEEELLQARKLEAVGQLAAGIAHEINTPIQFVGDSVYFLQDAYHDWLRLLEQYQKVVAAMAEREPEAAILQRVRELEGEVDLEFLLTSVPSSFERCMDGIGRVATIVRAMKEFAHPDQREQAPADLNAAIESTLTIARNEYKYVADAKFEPGSLPFVTCRVGELNQVFLNLIVNAAHAVGEVNKSTGERGEIRIRTYQEDDYAVVEISDTGGGIPESIRHRVYDPFFTTKGVGKGTGQGLAIARSVVVTKHGGQIDFESVTGEGTKFTIKLPIAGNHAKEASEP